jgi:glycosyltransferase involved in cell wall biosynthesis
MVFGGAAQAQATRTWVSGVGDDANPCSRTAPCKTFAGAISKTAGAGIINCIDAAGFGAVTITKSITIDCRNTNAGIVVSGTNGINIPTANIIVNLRGLDIEGVGIDGVGVDPVLFYPAATSRRKDKTRILFASRLLKSKGLNAFLMMARQLSDRPNLEFVVAGMADEKDPDAISPQQLSQLDEIRFLGEIENMPGLLRECDIVCLPTRYGEGIPRILIEAAATGLASIASDHPGCREAVEDGITGEIVAISSDSEMCRDMSAAVLEYLETPARLAAHKQAACERFRSREFNEKAVVARFVKLLGICPPRA